MESMRESIVMFPFMAEDHIIPFLALALKLEQQKGFSITFVNTPLNINRLRSSVPPTSSIRLLQIPFNAADHGLPPDADNADYSPSYDLLFRLLQVSAASLEPAFRKLLSDLIHEQTGVRPLCVIADIFFGWSARVAHEFGVFHALFSRAGGFGLACYYSTWINLPHRTIDALEFTLPDFPEAGCLHVTQLSPAVLMADGTDPWSVFVRELFPLWSYSDGILFNTIEEIDKVGLEFFRRILGRPAWPVGPVLSTVNDRARSGKKAGITLCIEWLDRKESNSVLYISFGSQNTISASQMMQLAKALEKRAKNFIWVLRPPLGFDLNAEFRVEEWLPEGFIQRVEEKERGLVVEKWAHQMEILSHRSISAFMTHCGWNSVLEALSCGVPLIGWPLAAEQFFNAKLLVEEVGVCVEVARGTDFEVSHEDLLEKMELERDMRLEEMHVKSKWLSKMLSELRRVGVVLP